MGFFSRNKDEKSNLPPAPLPPVAQGFNGLNAPGEVSRPMPSLSAPPMPSRSNSFDEIKSQVVSSPSNNAVENNNLENEQGISFGDLNTNDDSLFDFSTLDIADSVESSTSSSQPSFLQNRSSNISSSAVDSHLKNEGSLSFVKNRDRFGKAGSTDSIYVTTSQFKTFLEIVEQVRVRVKESSDKHLRLLDIKSEEDQEYEGLRKDFQYIEDKLYEVDSLIFDK